MICWSSSKSASSSCTKSYIQSLAFVKRLGSAETPENFVSQGDIARSILLLVQRRGGKASGAHIHHLVGFKQAVGCLDNIVDALGGPCVVENAGQIDPPLGKLVALLVLFRQDCYPDA